MQTGTWADLIGRIQALAGVETLLTTEATMITSLVNRRARQAYNASDSWARYLVAGQARPGPLGIIPFTYTNTDGNRNTSAATRDGYVVTVTTTADIDGDFVTGQSVVIAALTYSTANPNGTFVVTVTGDDTFTYELADDTLTGTETYGAGSGTVAPVALAEVDTFIRIFGSQPYNVDSAQELEYFTQSDGAHVLGNVDGLLGFFTTYKSVWDGPYESGDTIPMEWFEFIAHATYADFLRMDRRNDVAGFEEQLATDFLNMELMKPQNQFNNQITSRISTHLSRQSR